MRALKTKLYICWLLITKTFVDRIISQFHFRTEAYVRTWVGLWERLAKERLGEAAWLSDSSRRRWQYTRLLATDCPVIAYSGWTVSCVQSSTCLRVIVLWVWVWVWAMCQHCVCLGVQMCVAVLNECVCVCAIVWMLLNEGTGWPLCDSAHNTWGTGARSHTHTHNQYRPNWMERLL